MTYQYLLFDLDGTLSDPQEGIVNCLNFALQQHDLAQQPAAALTQFIGPPLDQTFAQLAQTQDAKRIQSLVVAYRERYADIGFRENTLYEGIPEVLATLDAQPGLTLGLCTSKRADFAHQILELFGIRQHFAFLSGGDVGIAKHQQIGELLTDKVINSRALMIGDRHFDLAAANRHNLDAAGVLWGFGSKQELQQHRPRFLFQRPRELTALSSIDR